MSNVGANDRKAVDLLSLQVEEDVMECSGMLTTSRRPRTVCANARHLFAAEL
jgi:hypothetical protein